VFITALLVMLLLVKLEVIQILAVENKQMMVYVDSGILCENEKECTIEPYDIDECQNLFSKI
jgi:hypothetical protein